MTPPFAYRARRAATPFQPADVGSVIKLDERTEYTLTFPQTCTPALASRFAELGGSFVNDQVGILSFGNFVGRTELGGVTLEIVSTKIGAGGVSALLAEISQLAATLIFGWRTPTAFSAALAHSPQAPVPYHQLQFLRRVMLQDKVGERLQDWLTAVERSPTRRFEPERPVTTPERVRRLDVRAVQSIFHRMERLVPVPATAPLAASPLAQALTFGAPPEAHFPAGIAAPRGRLSYDTPENRFVKHVVSASLALVYRFVDHPQLHLSLRQDCRAMLSMLEQAVMAPSLAEASRLMRFTEPSQALTKADGYREIFVFWQELSRHVSLPATAAETTRLLEGRDMATLYEYWVFLKVLEAVCAVTGERPGGPPQRRRDELGEALVVGLRTRVGAIITVAYNPTFTRTNATAYSTPLRPDVVVTIGERRFAFDAKYRLDRIELAESDMDDGLATYKRADLYKMHAYRDALTGIAAAFIVYPGTEFVFFERTFYKRSTATQIATCDGVGAIPLRPATQDPAADLRSVLSLLLSPQASSAA